MFTIQDLRNLQVFLNRIDIKGNEAMAMTDIQIKTNQMIQALVNTSANAPVEPPIDPPIDPPVDPPAVTPLPVGEGKGKH